jgi:purine-binding chemotaxis protein CheW
MARSNSLNESKAKRSVVTFFLGAEECALPITDVHQIIRDTPITRVPNVNPHVEGVVNLRGIVAPVIDLKHRLGLGVRTLGEAHRLLIVERQRRLVGFSVDALRGVLEFEQDQLQSAPGAVLARIEGRCVRALVSREQSTVVLLDLEEILNLGTDHETSPLARPTRTLEPSKETGNV